MLKSKIAIPSLLVLFALPIAGCMAHKNTTSDFDRTPIVNTGARAGIIYPGQSAPAMPGSVPQTQYSSPNSGSQQAGSQQAGSQQAGSQQAGSQQAGSQQAGTQQGQAMAPGQVTPDNPGTVPPGAAPAPQTYSAAESGAAPDDQISFLGGSRIDETRHVDIRKEPLVVKYLTAPLMLVAAPFVLVKEAIEGEAEPGPAIPSRPDPQLPQTQSGSRSPQPAQPQASYETAMLNDLERQLDQRDAASPSVATTPSPSGSTRTDSLSIADELRELQRTPEMPRSGGARASAPATENFAGAIANPEPKESYPTANPNPRDAYPTASGIVDRNNDDRIDQWIFRENGEISKQILDEDFDGRADRTIVFDLNTHRPSSVEEDSDGDGAVDSWADYENGIIVRRRSDSDRDGSVDTWSFFREGTLARHEQDANGDGFRDAISYFEDGRRVREERDSNGDGEPDEIFYYDGNEQLVRREEDRNTDGHLEVVSHYEAGRLVRRELLDAPALAGRMPEGQPTEVTR